MREILFRGKTFDGEWEEGSLHIEYGETTADGKRSLDYRILGMRGECRYVDPNTVGQYTGLTANDKKIFEGDIVQFQTRGSTFKPLYVRWYEECAQFIVTERDGFRSYPMDRSWRYEILGNICDNIELLREVDDG